MAGGSFPGTGPVMHVDWYSTRAGLRERQVDGFDMSNHHIPETSIAAAIMSTSEWMMIVQPA
jgi:hypothetical protein